MTKSAKDEVGKHGYLAAIQYCFSITWKLLQSMPPSVEFLEHLATTKEMPSKGTDAQDEEELDTCALLHSLLLLPRVEHKVFGSWIKDCLVKQGQTMAKAEELVKKTKSFNTFAYDVGQMKKLLQSLIARGESIQNKSEKRGQFVSVKRGSIVPIEDMPQFFDLVVLDTTMAKVQISLDRMFTSCGSSEGGNKSSAAATREQVAASAVERLLGVTEQLADAVDAAHDLVPLILQLVEAFSVCAKSLVLHSAVLNSHKGSSGEEDDDEETVIDGEAVKTTVSTDVLVSEDAEKDNNVEDDILNLKVLKCLAVGGSRCQHTQDLALRLNASFPPPLCSALSAWNDTSLLGFPPVSSWKSSSGQFGSYDGGNANNTIFGNRDLLNL